MGRDQVRRLVHLHNVPGSSIEAAPAQATRSLQPSSCSDAVLSWHATSIAVGHATAAMAGLAWVDSSSRFSDVAAVADGVCRFVLYVVPDRHGVGVGERYSSGDKSIKVSSL